MNPCWDTAIFYEKVNENNGAAYQPYRGRAWGDRRLSRSYLEFLFVKRSWS